MKDDFKLDAIVYSDKGAMGLYYPRMFEASRPYIAFLFTEPVSDEILQKFNALNAFYVIHSEKLIEPFLKRNFIGSQISDENLESAVDIYTHVKYDRKYFLGKNIGFKNIPDFISDDFLREMFFVFGKGYLENKENTDFGKIIFQISSVLAKRNHPNGYFNLATCYAAGIGIEISEKKALENVLKAAEMGFYPAKELLDKR